MKENFLPITREEMKQRGWDQVDFVYVSGDAYVDHPSFGHAIIARLLEAHGYTVGGGSHAMLHQQQFGISYRECFFHRLNLSFLWANVAKCTSARVATGLSAPDSANPVSPRAFSPSPPS